MTLLPRVKHAVRAVIAYTLYYSGVLALWQRVVMRRKAVVLMYHRVLTPEERRRTGSHPGIVVERESFANQMAVLKRRFAVLTLSEFVRCMEERVPFPDSSCLITFDDGWADNFANALPILREHGLPAVVFLPVNFIGARRLFWREALTHLLVEVVRDVRERPSARGRYQELLRPVGLEPVIDAAGADPRQDVVSFVASRTRLSAPAVERLLPELSAELGVALEALQTPDTFIDWEQANAMSREGVAFGGHGADHRLLTRIPAADAEREITVSRDVMQRTLNGAVPTFSYPNGDWNPDVAVMVRSAGYRVAFTTEPGFVTCEDDLFAVRRLNIHQNAADTTPMFLARVVGLF